MTAAAIPRETRRAATCVRVLDEIRLHGNGYSSASAALRSAAERNFGSWAKACVKAGIEPPSRGRPRTTSAVDEEALVRKQMRQWWLDRYTIGEIRELADLLCGAA